MSLQHLGRASALPTFRKKEAVALTLTNRNTYSKMLEDESIMVIVDGRKN